MQHEFKAELGMLVNQPKQGHESTNDGNSTRRLFSDYSNDWHNLRYRLWIILRTMSSSLPKNNEKFKL